MCSIEKIEDVLFIMGETEIEKDNFVISARDDFAVLNIKDIGNIFVLKINNGYQKDAQLYSLELIKPCIENDGFCDSLIKQEQEKIKKLNLFVHLIKKEVFEIITDLMIEAMTEAKHE